MPGIAEVAKRLRKAEKAVRNWDPESCLQLDPEGRLWIARPRPLAEGQPRPDYEDVAPIEGLHPELWRMKRPEGRFSLGLPYPGREQTCALSGEVFKNTAQVGLYFEGRPVRADLAKAEVPLLTGLYAFIASLGCLMQAERSNGKTSEEMQSEFVVSMIRFLCHDLGRRLSEEFTPRKRGKKKQSATV